MSIRAKLFSLTLSVILTAEIVGAAEYESRYVKKNNLPDAREIVVVAEGEFEPKSVGSYTVRIYSGVNPEFPMDDYVAGLVRPRNGSVEEVRFHDFDGDGRAEIVVVIRSVGTGGYLSADVFAYADKSLTLIFSVAGLAKDADLLAEIKQGIRTGLEKPQ